MKKRILLSVITMLLVILPLTSLEIEKVEAAEPTVTWTELTPEGFGNTHYATRNIIEYNGSIYSNFSGNSELNLYRYDGSSWESIIDDFDPGDYDSVRGVGADDDYLYVSFEVDAAKDELWTFDGTNWDNISDAIPANVYDIEYMHYFNGGLFLWVTYSEDMVNYDQVAYLLYEGSWQQFSGPDSFAPIDTLDLMVMDFTYFGTIPVVLFYDDNTGDSILAAFNGDSGWMQLASYEGYRFNFEFLDENFVTLTSDWGEPVQLEYLVEGTVQTADWLPVGLGDEDNNSGILLVKDDYLYIGLTKFQGVNGQIARYDGEEIEILSDYIGIEGTEDHESNSWVNHMIEYNGDIIVSVGWSGEGPYHTSVWRMEINEPDSDPISQEVEDAAPNDGDGNFDNIPDSNQNNVASFVNPVTNKYVSVDINDACSLTEVGSQAEGENETQDTGYDYPLGFVNFTADCGTPGYTATINLYYHGSLSDEYVLKKYIPENSSYTLIEQRSFAYYEENNVFVVTYQIQDGSAFDINGLEDGIIQDPVGLGINALGIPNTGFAQK